jgi:hypothetical protein
VPVFIERFILPVAAAILVLVIVTNPMNFDMTQRITGGIALVFIAWFLSHTIHLRNEAKVTSPTGIKLTDQPHQPVATSLPAQASPDESDLPRTSRRAASQQHSIEQHSIEQHSIEQRSTGANSPNVATRDNSPVNINNKEP